MGQEDKSLDIVYQTARYLKSPVIELEKVADLKGTPMHYTDGLHLDRASSAVCSLWLEEILASIFNTKRSLPRRGHRHPNLL
jgi:hypothetical protein